MRRVAWAPAGSSSVNTKEARWVAASNFVSAGASSAPDEVRTRVAAPSTSSAAALKVTILVAFTTSRLEAGKDRVQAQMTLYALNFYKPSEFLLLEVCPESQVVVSRTGVRWETVVIGGLLGRHVGGRDRRGVVK